MKATKLGRSTLAAFCAASLVVASCGGGASGGGEPTLLDDTSPRAGVANWEDELGILRKMSIDFEPSAPYGALPGRSWGDDRGAAHYAIPLDVAPGPNGHGPQLSLSYSSQAGNGPVGVGFSVASTPMVSRCQRTLPKDGYYEALSMGKDDPICFGGQRLILATGTYGEHGATYRLESDPSKRFSTKGSLDGPVTWFMDTADGETFRFEAAGGTEDRWWLQSIEDQTNNFISYSWNVLPDHEVLLAGIVYGGTGSPGSARKVRFLYEDRPDQAEGYVRGDLHRATQRMRTILSEGPDASFVARYELEYDVHPHTRQSVLSSVTRFDKEGVALPPTVFQWAEQDAPSIAEEASSSFDQNAFYPELEDLPESPSIIVFDQDGNGSDELLAYDPVGEEYLLHGYNPGHPVHVQLNSPELMPEPWEPPCGNGVIDAGEECDGGETSISSCWQVTLGTLGDGSYPTCSASCQLDFSGCPHCDDPNSNPLCAVPEPEVAQLTDLYRIKPSVGLVHINWDYDDPRSQLLVPIASHYAADDGVDEWGVSRAQLLRVAIPSNVGNTEGTDLVFSYEDYALGDVDPIYSIVPLEFNGDGRDDLFMCQGQGYKSSHWRLALSRDPVATGQIGWDFFDTGVGCSTHDEYTVLPADRGTEVLAVIPRYETRSDFMQYPIDFGNDPDAYQSGVAPIPESDRGGYRVLNFDPATNAGELADEEILPRDIYQRNADLNCNNGYVISQEGAPLLGAGLSRDLAIDVDGDGNRDILRYELLNGDGVGNISAIQQQNSNDEGFHYTESCSGAPNQPGVVRLYRNTGAGYVVQDDPVLSFPGSPHDNLFLNWYAGHQIDWNADGLMDIVLPSDGVADYPNAPEQDEDWTLLLSNGNGGFSPIDVTGLVPWPHHVDGADTASDLEGLRQTRIFSRRGARGETEGPDTWFSSGAGRLYFMGPWGTQNVQSRQNGGAVLSSATDGQGLRHSFEMVRTGSGHLLRERTVNVPGTGVAYDAPSNQRSWKYEYSRPVRDRYGMFDVGFAWVRETFLGGRGGYQWDRATQLRTYDHSYDSQLRAYPRSGTPSNVETAWVSRDGYEDEAWHVECNRTLEWAVDTQALPGGQIWQAYPAESESFSVVRPPSSYSALSPGHALGPGPTGQCADFEEINYQTHVVSSQSRDDYGNVLDVSSAALRGVTEQTSQSTSFELFQYDENEWLIANPTVITSVSCVGDETTGGEQECKSRTTELEYEPGYLLVASVTREPGTPFQQATTLSYEEHGNVELATVSTPTQGSRMVITNWDAEGVRPLSVVNPLGQTTEMVFHAASGLPVASVDPNGLTAKVKYDGFFRAVGSSSHSSPLGPSDGADTTVVLDETQVAGAAVDVVVSSQGQETRTSYDRAGRVVRELWHGVAYADSFPVDPTLDGPERCQWFEYDPFGRTLRSSEATAECGTPPAAEGSWYRNEYDNGGRLLHSEWDDDDTVSSTLEHLDYLWTGSTSIEGLPTVVGRAVTATDPEGKSTTHVVDALGRVSASVDALGTMTCFDYGPFGEVQAVHRNCGYGASGPAEVSTYSYDPLSRLVSTTEPANGTQIRSYTEFDELDLAVDAKGQVLDHEYDDLGRLISRTSPDGIATWDYDLTLVGALGEQMSEDGVRQVFGYDAFGRSANTTHYMPALSTGSYTIKATDSYRFSYDYDELGRLSSVRYPTNLQKTGLKLGPSTSFQADFHYDGSNNLRSISGAGRTLWALSNSNEAGLPEDELFNLVPSDPSVAQTKTTAYQAFTNRVRSIGVVTTAPLQNFEYEWTPAGNLQRRSEGTTGQSETFGYDDLHRLTDVNGGISVQYDALGNITERLGIGDYGYHASSGRLAWFGAPANTVDYDANGNIERIEDVDIGWSALDKVRTLSNGTEQNSFVYDASGARSLRYNDSSYTMTVGGLYELSRGPGEKSGSTQTTARYLVPVGGAVVEVRDTLVTGATKWKRNILYQYNDHLGSGSVLVSDSGAVKEAVSYGPWGEARDWDSWAQTVPSEVLETLASGFTGHQPELDTGLINMRGRMYSPEIARFLSVDPVVESVGDAQTWNAYSYVQNNPLSMVDPDGNRACRLAICEAIAGGGDISRPKRTTALPSNPIPGGGGGGGGGPFGPGSTGSASPGGGGGKSGAGGSTTRPNGVGQGGPRAGLRLDYSSLNATVRLPWKPTAGMWMGNAEIEVIYDPLATGNVASSDAKGPNLSSNGTVIVLMQRFELYLGPRFLGSPDFGVYRESADHKTLKEHEEMHLRVHTISLKSELDRRGAGTMSFNQERDAVVEVTRAFHAAYSVAAFVNDKFDARSTHGRDATPSTRFGRERRIMWEVRRALRMQNSRPGVFTRRAARWHRLSKQAQSRMQDPLPQPVRNANDYLPILSP